MNAPAQNLKAHVAHYSAMAAIAQLEAAFAALNQCRAFADADTTLDDKFAVAETALDELVHGAREYLSSTPPFAVRG